MLAPRRRDGAKRLKTMSNRRNILTRWKSLLAKLGGRVPAEESPEYWPHVLYMKVLRYLVARYEDDRRWRSVRIGNDRSERPPPRRSAQAQIRAALQHAHQPPKSCGEIRPVLQHIRSANVKSYAEVG